MFDLRFYNATGIWDTVAWTSERMENVKADAPVTKSIEVIGGKVVKYLLTSKGSDAFNPDYGGTALHHQQISPQFIPQISFEMHADVENCVAFIKAADIRDGNTGERLESAAVLDIRYDPRLTPSRLDVLIEIRTTAGKRGIVAVTERTDVP